MPNAILDPTGQADHQAHRRAAAAPASWAPAKRRPGLGGARVGLLINTKQNAAPFLAEVGRLLVERHGAASVLARTKAAFALPAPEDMLQEFISECDLVVTGIGDCGSCSASAVTDGVTLEIRGIPTAAICSDAFKASADAIASLHGAPGYRYVTTRHPVAVLTPGEVRERAAQALPEVVSLLVAGDGEGRA
jgi:hypothetical protein